MPWAWRRRSICGLEMSASVFASAKLVARKGTLSTPKTASSFSSTTISSSPICACPVCTARLISGTLNSEALAWTVIWSAPFVACRTSSAKDTSVSEWKLDAA